MLSTLPTRPARLEICPPTLRRPAQAWLPRLRAWLAASWPGSEPAAGGSAADLLALARHEFHDAVADLSGSLAEDLLDRIAVARSLRELWHLRAEVFSLVSLQHSQHAADTRLAQLNRHFPSRSPRSGFGALEPRDMWP